MPLKITVLLENRRGKDSQLIAKAGLSLLIQDQDTTVLFDTGPDASFVHNATLMGVDLANIDAVVLSHGHYDHCGGVSALPHGTRIICHPAIIDKRFSSVTLFGYTPKIKKLSLDIDYSPYRMQFSRTPLDISQSIMWSGEIHINKPHAYGVLAGTPDSPDYIQDEGVLIYKSSRGLVIVTGCGHRGIGGIVEHCKNITGINQVYALIGGFHLRCASPSTLLSTKKLIAEQRIEKVMGCHCTGLWGRLWIPNMTSPMTGDVIYLD